MKTTKITMFYQQSTTMRSSF